MTQRFETLLQLFAKMPTEQAAIDHLTKIRFGKGKFCPLCGCADQDKVKVMNKAGVPTNQYKCYACRGKFTIKVGTIFQDTKLPLRTWFAAIWMITNHPKGIASTTLAKDLGITQKSAWFIMHRLRHAARTDSFNAPLDGVVEIDETFVGGKEINKHKAKRLGRGPGHVGKTPVLGMLERGGQLRAGVVANVQQATVQPLIHAHVAKGATVCTDEAGTYRGLKGFDHKTTSHGSGQYVDGLNHTQSIESVWALLKRQIVGIHHYVSPKHLDRYVTEMTFRFNRRELDCADRMNALLGQVEGRLTYKDLTA